MSRPTSTAGSAPAKPSRKRRNERGVVLAIVIVIAFLLSTAVITFARRAVVDVKIIGHRDQAARAEALARSGIQIGMHALLVDLIASNAEEEDAEPQPPGDTMLDSWAQFVEQPIEVRPEGDPDGIPDILELEVVDVGSRLNLNALRGDEGELSDTERDEAVDYLIDVFSLIIDDLPIPPGERALYDPRELGENLIDYLDVDDLGRRGSDENAYYERQDPPYEPANGPLLSVQELARVEGFDKQLVEGLSPYVTIAGAGGVNLNTAPAEVLRLVAEGSANERKLISDDTVEDILKDREQGFIICDGGEAQDDRCKTLQDYAIESVFPPSSGFPINANLFTVRARARVGDVTRRMEALVDRNPAEPRILSWRLQ